MKHFYLTLIAILGYFSPQISFASTEYLSAQASRAYGPSRYATLAAGQTITKDTSGYVIGSCQLAGNNLIQTLKYGTNGNVQLATASSVYFNAGYVANGTLSANLQSLDYGNNRFVVLNPYSGVSFTTSGYAPGRLSGGGVLSNTNQTLYYGPSSSTYFARQTSVSLILGQVQVGTISGGQYLVKVDGTSKYYAAGTQIQFNSAGRVVSPQ